LEGYGPDSSYRVTYKVVCNAAATFVSCWAIHFNAWYGQPIGGLVLDDDTSYQQYSSGAWFSQLYS